MRVPVKIYKYNYARTVCPTGESSESVPLAGWRAQLAATSRPDQISRGLVGQDPGPARTMTGILASRSNQRKPNQPV